MAEKNKSYQRKLIKLERQKQIDRVERMYVAGETNRTRIAARTGISYTSVVRYVSQIRDRWEEEDKDKLPVLRADAIQRNRHLYQQAMLSFEQSKQTEEQVSTTHTSIKCNDCGGTGKKDKKKCSVCDGKGEQIEEVTVRRVDAKPGDPAFHRAALEASKEISRLQGLPEKEKVVVSPTQVNVNVVGAIDWDKIPLVELKEYRKMHQKLVQLSSGKGLTVDVESKET